MADKKVEKLKREVRRKEDQIKAAHRATAPLQAQLNKARDKLNGLKRELYKAKEENGSMRLQLSAKDVQIAKLKQKIQELELAKPSPPSAEPPLESLEVEEEPNEDQEEPDGL